MCAAGVACSAGARRGGEGPCRCGSRCGARDAAVRGCDGAPRGSVPGHRGRGQARDACSCPRGGLQSRRRRPTSSTGRLHRESNGWCIVTKPFGRIVRAAAFGRLLPVPRPAFRPPTVEASGKPEPPGFDPHRTEKVAARALRHRADTRLRACSRLLSRALCKKTVAGSEPSVLGLLLERLGARLGPRSRSSLFTRTFRSSGAAGLT